VPEAIVRVDVVDGVRTLTLDSQHNRNALSRAMVAELRAALDAAGDDPDTRVVVLQAAGPAFCAGADLKEMTSADDTDRARGTTDMLALFRAVLTCPRPVVAKVHAAVRAGGIGLVAAADVAISAESVRYALTEVRLGLAPAVISLVVGPRMTSRAASRTWLTGETFTADEAAANGLVTQAVPDDQLDAVVTAVVAEIARSPGQGLAATKQLLNREVVADLDARGASLGELSAELFSSEVAQELMGRFLGR
jgi:enoyl-CoA hydratase/methylglutaconyl-CoA hydratase